MSKSALSWGMVAAGIVLGISFVAFVAPVMWYTAGLHDNPWGRYAVYALMFSTLPGSILAIYTRFWAGVWLTLVGLYATIAMSWNGYQLVLAHTPDVDYGEVIGDGGVALVVAAIGIFFCVTAALRWPSLSTGAVSAD
jgi:hypothetical protein